MRNLKFTNLFYQAIKGVALFLYSIIKPVIDLAELVITIVVAAVFFVLYYPVISPIISLCDTIRSMFSGKVLSSEELVVQFKEVDEAIKVCKEELSKPKSFFSSKILEFKLAKLQSRRVELEKAAVQDSTRNPLAPSSVAPPASLTVAIRPEGLTSVASPAVSRAASTSA